MLTVQWQTLGPELGAGVPEQVDEAGCGDDYRRALELSRLEYERLVDGGLRSAAPYALCLGYRLRFILDLNAREAMQPIELRSGREGHPSYRAVAHAMYERIAAVHRSGRGDDDARRQGNRAAPGADPGRNAHAGTPEGVSVTGGAQRGPRLSAAGTGQAARAENMTK